MSFVSALAVVPTPGWAQAGASTRSIADDTGKGVEGDAIVVTGQSLSLPNVEPQLPVMILLGDALAHRRRGTLGETLDGLPGVHMDNFGAGASRPVIRGQTFPRIAVLSDGAELFDASSVSPDHAIVTNPLLLDAIEVQRGPAAVRYGGNAVNGAINLIDGKVPRALPESGFDGAYELRYGTADQEMTAAGRVTAALGPIALHAEGSRSYREDYDVPDSYGTDRLRDSFGDSSSYAFGTSWVMDKGYIGVAYTRQNAEYGLPGHSHINGVCHTHGLDLHCESHGSFNDPFFNIDDSHTAFIKLRSERVDVRGDFTDLLPGFSNLRVRGSYTDYRHDEVDGPALFARYSNEAYDGRIELTHKPLFGFVGTLGVQYTDAKFDGLNQSDRHRLPIDFDFSNAPEGFRGYTSFLPPFYKVTENWGVFLNERRSFGPIDIEIAARKDWRTITHPLPEVFAAVVPPATEAIFESLPGGFAGFVEGMKELYTELYLEENPAAEHDPFSASIGATWNIDGSYSAALSLARTERAPNVRELYAQGNNLATNSFELGLARTHYGSRTLLPEPTTDVMETAKTVNLTLRKTDGPFEFEVGLYHQDVDDYIFARLIETEIATGIPHNYLVYVAANASFTGIDGQVSYTVSPESLVTLFGDYVATDLKGEGDNLPRIPPGRLGARYQGRFGPLSADVEYYRTFAQEAVALYETPTDGYNMVNATIAYCFAIPGASDVELYARGTNLTNELAFVHTSFVKDQSPLRGRSVVVGLRHQF